ncbi:MAG: hypothetical protein LQ345_005454 [Seirophora villosa]|nr:MAG: hypothetical protein LQ345_005454 [Seirophora villosa]
MGELPGSSQHVGDSSARPPNRKQSVMRRYLESGVDFEWPEGVGKRVGNHCDLYSGPGHHIPLIWKSRISDKKASIDIYMGGEQYAFKEAFAVKTIREKTYLKSRTRARKEVENMRDLRFPHVAALLGTFTYLDRLSILIFPAAPCDLHKFLKVSSKEMRDLRRGRCPLQELVNHSSRADTTDSLSSTSSSIDGPGSPRFSTHSLSGPGAAMERDDWPLKLALPAKVERLREYFVCLSQALSYIHENDVRHKGTQYLTPADIKPENILIDASGSVVLTDFGISRRFPKMAPHVTNDKWEMTRKYASPEIMKGRKVPRDDPSDVFSLGCVFLEMASLILGRDLRAMADHYASVANDSGPYDAYYCNLPRVYTWIEELAQPRTLESRSIPEMTDEKIKGQDFVTESSSTIINALDTIRNMLDIEPSTRPPAKGLWQAFKHVSTQICRDCDPRLPEDVWTPNRRQKDAVESGTSRRRSMQLIPEEASDNPSTETKDTRDGQAENENFLSANYRPDRNSLMGRRASSPHPNRQQTQHGRPYNSAPVHSPRSPPTNPEANGSALPSDDGVLIRRTSSATDGRRAETYEHPSGSRSMSPRRRRPFSESRLQFNAGAASHDTAPALQSQRDKPLGPPQPSRPDRGPVVQNSAGSSPSLVVQQQTSTSDAPGIQEKPGPNGHSHHQKHQHMQPGTQIIIYDISLKQAYVGAFAQLTEKAYGIDYISQPLPKAGQHIEIGEKGSPIATVDLGSLGMMTSLKRLAGGFPTLFVLNFSKQPG